MDYTLADMAMVATLIILTLLDIALIALKKPSLSERITFLHRLRSPFLCLLLAYLYFHWFAK